MTRGNRRKAPLLLPSATIRDPLAKRKQRTTNEKKVENLMPTNKSSRIQSTQEHQPLLPSTRHILYEKQKQLHDYFRDVAIREAINRVPQFECFGVEFLALGEIEVIENSLKAISVILSMNYDLEKYPIDFVHAFIRLKALNTFLRLCDNFYMLENDRCSTLIQLIAKAWFNCLYYMLPTCLFPMKYGDPILGLTQNKLKQSDIEKLEYIDENIPDFVQTLQFAVDYDDKLTSECRRFSHYSVLLRYVIMIWKALKDGNIIDGQTPLSSLTSDQSQPSSISDGVPVSETIKLLAISISTFFSSSLIRVEQNICLNIREHFDFIYACRLYEEKYGWFGGISYDLTKMSEYKREQLYCEYRTKCFCSLLRKCSKSVKDFVTEYLI